MTPTYASPGPRSTAAILALYVKVGSCLLTIGALLRRIVVAGDLGQGDVLVDRLLAADQLVTAAALFELLMLGVAGAFLLRLAVVVRANLPALGTGRPELSRGLAWTWTAALALAVLLGIFAWVVLGDAADVAERQRIDAFRAASSAVSALATGLTIAVVAQVTRRQEDRALEIDAPRAGGGGGEAEESISEGGLRVLSEEQARRDPPAR